MSSSKIDTCLTHQVTEEDAAMINDYRVECKEFKVSIDRKVAWNIVGVIAFVGILVWL